MNPVEPEFISRGVDYLGTLGMKLRDLTGYATLAFELLQNADDAKGATFLRFDLTQAALVADNDGVFSDCGRMDAGECPWKSDPAIGHRCDFHRFRHVAGGDKRNQVSTVGAFGIGFTSVYQITDAPELFSNGRHWILNETRPEAERIQACRGCSKCRSASLPGTRFILPWAFDSNSDMRLALGAQAVDGAVTAHLWEEFTTSLPTALLFLNRLRRVEVLKEGEPALRIEREDEGDMVVLEDGAGGTATWHLVRGTFDSEAAALRQKHARIEAKRRGEVVLAIPEKPLAKGHFCAYLPTRHDTGLPFLVNADFFPKSDRKQIIFDADFQSEWNRAAVAAAARTFAAAVPRLPSLLGHEALWQVISAIHVVGIDAAEGRRDSVLGTFWRELAPQIARHPLFMSTRGEWKRLSEIRFIDQDDAAAAEFFEGLGLPIVHESLRRHHNLLRSRDIGVVPLSAEHLAEALEEHGLFERMEREDWPCALTQPSGLEMLWKQAELLLSRHRSTEDLKEAERRLASCALALGVDGALWPCTDIYRADAEAVKLFSALDPEIRFLADISEAASLTARLCPEFTAAVAAECLRARLREEPSALSAITTSNLFAWLDSRSEELGKSSDVRDRWAELPVFPSASEPRRLRELVLPGDFTDPIGLADLLDLEACGGRRALLERLGAQPLHYAKYVAEYIPRAFRDPATSASRKEQALQLLAARLDDIRGNQSLRGILANPPLIPCEDGQYRSAHEVYFAARAVTDVLGAAAPTARLPRDRTSAVREFYEWVGVEGEPRLPDVVQRVRTLTSTPPTAESIEAIRAIFRFLGEQTKSKDQIARQLDELRRIKWLPSQEAPGEWHYPQSLYAAFRKHLFESQARFLDVPGNVQNASTALLQFLEIQYNPSVTQVVDHLRASAAERRVVNREVYTYLDDAADNPVITRLRGIACLLLPDNTYVRPDQVFWSDHPFGRYRFRLGPEVRTYARLLEALEVKAAPDHVDALKLLVEIADSSTTQELDGEARTIVMHCWQMLDTAYEHDLITGADLYRRLHNVCSIPAAGAGLLRPDQTFFEDRAGLAARFGPELRAHAIPRPQGTWRAMAAAGVQSLSSAIQTHLIECLDAAEHPVLTAVLQERKAQIARVLESVTDSEAALTALESLALIRCVAVTDLKVQYSVRAFGREIWSSAESVPAHYQRGTKVLYFVRTASGGIPWPSAARELAIALRPDAEPGQMSSGLKEVMAAESAVEADAMLDDLGYPPLELVIDVGVAAGQIVTQLGGDPAPAEPFIPPAEPAGEPAPAKPASPSAPPRPASPSAPPMAAGPSAPATGHRPAQPHHAPGRSTQPAAPQTNTTAGASAKNGMEPEPKKSEPRRRPDRLRTYVAPQNEDPSAGDPHQADPQAAAHREAVDRAGVDRVLAWEREAGRFPIGMPHSNPGYDVLSCDADGVEVRHIEVKSLSGGWDFGNAVLSHTQFKHASDYGDLFWLYVVERATEPDFQIHRIQNPAGRANEFIFDDGWQALAEEAHANDGGALQDDDMGQALEVETTTAFGDRQQD